MGRTPPHRLQNALSAIGAPPGFHLSSEAPYGGSGRSGELAYYAGTGSLDAADSWMSSRLQSVGLRVFPGADSVDAACGRLEVWVDYGNQSAPLMVRVVSSSTYNGTGSCPPGLLDP